MIKRLLILLLLAGPIMAYDGTFDINTAAEINDNYIFEDQPTTVYGSTDIRVGWEKVGGSCCWEYRGWVDMPALPESLDCRTVDSACLFLDISVKTGTFSGNDTIKVWAVMREPMWGNYTTWNNYTTDAPWDAGGCYTPSVDYHDTLVAIFEVTDLTVSDSLMIPLDTIIKYDWHRGGLILAGNWSGASNDQYFAFVCSEAISGNKPRYHVEWSYVDTDSVDCVGPDSLQCDMGVQGQNDWYGVSKWPTLALDCYLDSMLLIMDAGGGSTDTMWAICYMGDSSFIGSSDSIITDGTSGCKELMFQFSGEDVVDGDSVAFFGAFVNEDANSWNFCVIGDQKDANGCIVGTSARWPEPLTGDDWSHAYCPCFRAYFTPVEQAAAAGQVIIIGSCESEQTPFYHTDRGYWCSVPERDLVFGR